MQFKVPYSGISNRLGQEEADMLLKAVGQDTLCLGPMNAEFDKRFAEYLGAKSSQATSSCTTALFLAAQVLGLKEGDEVITTPQTFWVTTWPLQWRKCVIRFADIDPNSLNMDPATVERLITPKTRSIWVVHYGGQAVDMDPIMDIARRHNLTVVEDCAHSPGTTYKGRKVGTIGDIGCFSFHSLKNMTTGEGGAFVTNNARYAEMARHLGTIHVWGEMADRPIKKIGPYPKLAYYQDWHVRFSFDKDYVNRNYEIGNNFRMSEFGAAVGIAQLKKLDQLNRRRREIAARLDAGLSKIEGIGVQKEKDYGGHIYHLYTCFYDEKAVGAPKDDFLRMMEQEEGVQIVLRYFPVHLLSEFRALGYEFGLCPVAEKTFFEHQVQLPIFTHLTDDQIEHMIGAVTRSVAKLRKRK